MSHRRYLAAIAIGFALPLAFWMGLVLFQLGEPTESSQWIKDMVVTKQRTAMSKGPNKIVLIAGSSARYNISAAMIEEATGTATVNMATTAGLGLDYLLEQSKSVLSPGDVIVLAPEYELYLADGSPTTVLLDYVLAQDPHYLTSLPLRERLNFIYAIPWERLWLGVSSRLFGPPGATGRWTGLGQLNAHGDETNNREEDRTEAHVTKILSETSLTILLQGIPDDSSAWRQLGDFAAWCREHDIRLLASFPSTLAFPEYDSPPATATFAQITRFYEQHDVPVLGTPHDFMYDEGMMFDTLYHLNDRGVELNTQKVVNLLAPYLPLAGSSTTSQGADLQQ